MSNQTHLIDAIDLFINRPEINPQTKRGYRYDLGKMADFIGPRRPVPDIIPADMLRYAIYLDNDDNIASDHTYNKHITHLRAFFNWCVDMQLIDESPVAPIATKSVSRRVEQSKAMPDIQLLRLIDYVSETARGWNPREEALVRFLADTGSRIGGARTLTYDRLDIKNRRATIIKKGGDEMMDVIFGRECAHALNVWRFQQERTEGNYVFSEDGHLLSVGSLGQYFRRLCTRAKCFRRIKGKRKTAWGPHSLRHRFGHTAAKKGISASVLAEMLGDTVEVVIQHYMPKDTKSVERAMRQMVTDHLRSRADRDELLASLKEEGS